MTAAAVYNTFESKDSLQQELRTRGLLGVPDTASVISPTLSDNSEFNSLSSPATSNGQTHNPLGFNQKRVPDYISASVLLGVNQEHVSNNALSSNSSSSRPTSSLLMNRENTSSSLLSSNANQVACLNQLNAPSTQMTSYTRNIPKHQHTTENVSTSTQFARLMFNPAFSHNTSSPHTIPDFSHTSLPTSIMSNPRAGFHGPASGVNTSAMKPVHAFNPIPTFNLVPVSAFNTSLASSAQIILVPAFTSNCVPASSRNFQSPPQSVKAFSSMRLPVSVVQPVVNTDQAIRHRFPLLSHRISNNFTNTTFTNPNSIGQDASLRNFRPAGVVPTSSFKVRQDVMMQNIINTDINKSNDASQAVLHQANGVNLFNPHSSGLKHHTDIQNPGTLIPVTSSSQMQHASPSFSIPCIKFNDFGSRSSLSHEDVTMVTNKAQSSVGSYDPMSISNTGITEIMAGDQHVVKATTVVSMESNDVITSQSDKTPCCDVTRDAPSLVITNVVGGSEAKKMVEIGKFESCEESSSGDMEEAEELCISGGSIQNVLLQGDQVSSTTRCVQLEVHIGADVYKGKFPESSKGSNSVPKSESSKGRNSVPKSESSKGSNSVPKSKTSNLCSLENININRRCSLSDSASEFLMSYINYSNSTNADTISSNVCSSNGITIKKEKKSRSSSIENLRDVHCPVLPSFPNSVRRDTNIRGQGTETEISVVVHGITSGVISSIQTSPVNSVPGDRLSPTGTAVASVARDMIHRQTRSKSRSNKEYNYKDEPSGGMVPMIGSGVDGRKSPNDPLTCCVCGVSLSRHQTLKRHLRSHYGYDPFKCLECYKVFCNMRELDKHIPQHEGVNPFVCIHCGQCFILKRNHDVHLQLHLENSLKDSSCCVCDKTFESYGPLVDHLKTHSDAQSLTCKHCGKRLPTGIDLLIHTRSHDHSQISKDASTSRKNSTKSKRLSTERSHDHLEISKDASTSLKNSTKCKISSTESDLDDHRSSHSRANHKNDVTNSRQRIPKKTDSRDSRTMRTKRKSLTCNVCGKTFEKAADVVAHRFQHVGEQDADRKYECEECGSKFKRSWHLKEHQRCHTGVKYYGCSVCGEKFKRSNQMTKHKKGHFTASNR